MKTIGFIGGGRITRILLQAFKNNGTVFDKVVVLDTNPQVLDSLQLEYPHITTTPGNLREVGECRLIVMAVHPPVLLEALSAIKEFLSDDSVVLSLAPKITIEKMTAILGPRVDIARMNPSASTIVNKGVNSIVFSSSISAGARSKLLGLFEPLGFTPEVTESKMEAYAVISAMGHTYFFFQLQKLKELAVDFGMDEDEAQTTIAQMLWGTSQTLFHSGLPYEEVANLVPVKPLSEVEETIKGYYDLYLTGIFNKIKP